MSNPISEIDVYNRKFDSDNYYVTELPCSNCGKKRFFKIVKGISVHSELEDVPCEFCGCDIIKREEYKR